MTADILSRIPILFPEGRQHLPGGGAADLSVGNHLHQRCQMGRRNRNLLSPIQQPEDLGGQEGRQLPGMGRTGCRFLEIGHHARTAGEQFCLSGGQPHLLHVAGLLLVGQGRHSRPQGRHHLFRRLNGHQVGVGEVAVIVGVLLAAHGEGFAGLFVKPAGLLDNLLPPFQRLYLPLILVLDSLLDELEGVEVLHLGAGAEGFPRLMHRQVDVAPEGTFLHPAVGNPCEKHHGPKLLQVGHGLLRRADVRLRHNLDERHAAPVAVQITAVLVMDQLTGVLLNVNPGDADFLGSRRGLDFQRTLLAKGQVVLGNLVGLGQVGVEIVLPVLLGVFGNGAAGGHAGLDGILHHLLVQDRQRAGQSHTNRAALGVGRCAEPGGAATENLGLGLQLHMDLETHHHLIFCHGYPSSDSKALPSWRRAGSEKAGPVSCMPTGRPSASLPQDSDSAGKPAIFTGTV